MRQNKKGISPLIATVLLIGFSIAIAILIWMWYGNIVNERTAKISAQGNGEIICSSQISYSIKSVCTSDETIIIKIENKGADIDNFKITLTGSTSKTDTVTVGTPIAKTQTKEISSYMNVSKIGTIKKVSIVPVVSVQGLESVCLQKKQESTSIKPC